MALVLIQISAILLPLVVLMNCAATAKSSASPKTQTVRRRKSSEMTSCEDQEDSVLVKRKAVSRNKKKVVRKQPSAQKMPRKYQPPAAQYRPRHPGFEAPVEPSEEHTTLRQIERLPPNIRF